jgi:hypothetical protein
MTAPHHFACMNSATACRDVEIQTRQSHARACSWWCHAHPLLPDLQYLLLANSSWNFCKEEIQVKGPFIVGTWACGFQERRTTYASLSLSALFNLFSRKYMLHDLVLDFLGSPSFAEFCGTADCRLLKPENCLIFVSKFSLEKICRIMGHILSFVSFCIASASNLALTINLLPKPKLYPVTAPSIAPTVAHHLHCIDE